MYRNYYNRDRRPSSAPEPYGEVPPQSGKGIVPRPGETALPKKETAPLRRKGNVLRFFLLLILIGALTVTGVVLNGGLGHLSISLERVEDVWNRVSSEYHEYGSLEWLDKINKTSAARAPLGDGTVLTLAPAGKGEADPREIYDRVSPCVVGVVTAGDGGMHLATGVIMSSDGYIITNAHVISGAKDLAVSFAGGKRVKALLVGYDGVTDLAVLKVNGEGLPAAQFGDSSQVRVGDTVYAIGNPLGEELRGTMTDGIISAIDRNVTLTDWDMTLLQTTAPLNSGNSGGALVNAAGQVIGITNMKMMSDRDTLEGLGFAIPSTLVKEVVDQLIDRGEYVGAPAIGIMVYDVPAEGNSPAGLYVSQVEERSDARAKGVREGDIIVEANGVNITCFEDLEQVKAQVGLGGTIRLKLWREGEVLEIPVALIGRRQL